MPAEQVVQLVFELVSSVPAAQVRQELEPEVEYCPDAHDVHELRVWLEEDWYLPAAHERQLPPERYCPLEQVGVALAHDQLADQPDRVTLPSVVKRTRM